MNESLVLVNPNWRWDDSPLAVDTLRPPVCPPLEFAYIASGLQKRPIVLDAYAEDLSIEEFSDRLAIVSPTTVVVTTTPSILYWRCPPFSIKAPREAIVSAKSQGARTIAIGPHPTYAPRWFVNGTNVDVAFRGAPERRLNSVIYDKRRLLDSAVWRSERSSVISVEQAKDLPLADFSIFNYKLPYEPHMWCVSDKDQKTAGKITRSSLIESSRGCPWSCTYCAKGPVRDRFERRPVDRVILELKSLYAQGIEYVFFVDETFNIRDREFFTLLDALERLPLVYGIQGRPDLVTPVMAKRLEASGCVYAEMGIDVSLNDLSDEIGRKQKLEAANRGISLLTDHLPIVRFNRLNLQTIDYRDRFGYPFQQGWSYPPDPAFPYPGSPLGDDWSKWYGEREGEFDWEKAEEYAWWLRLEVMMQRSGHCPSDDELRSLMNEFLKMEPARKREVATRFSHIGPMAGFHRENLFVQGEGNGD